MQRTRTHLRIGFGLVAMAAVLALAVVMTMAGSNNDTTFVSATGPTPTTEPNPGTDGILSGIFDLEVFPGANAQYHCISRVDHDLTSNRIKFAAQCNTDVPGLGDPADILFGVSVPGELADGVSGPVPPPPYSNLTPHVGAGQYYPGGHADCPTATTCSTVTVCIEDFGAGALGPNLVAKLILDDPNVTPNDNSGRAELYPGASNKQCANLDPSALAILGAPFPLGSFKAGTGSEVSWRTALGVSAGDFDGDGCSDFEELDTKGGRDKGCGDDPYSPLDSHIAGFGRCDPAPCDYSGPITILTRVTRADVGAGGSYFSCTGDVVQAADGKDTSSTTPGLKVRVFCYTDSTLGVNLLGYPGVSGDGFPGGGPAWGPIAIVPACFDPTDCTPTEQLEAEDAATECGRFNPVDDDADTVINDGCPVQGFGDTDSKQTELIGYVDNADNTLKLRGCFEDEDASSNLQNVYVEAEIDANTGIGTVDIWALQSEVNCTGDHAWGTYKAGPGGQPLEAFDDTEITVGWQQALDNQNPARGRDTDQDGCSNASELSDDPATGGLRDPYNPYDWYDIDKNGVINLFGDILGVISSFSLDGEDPYDVNNDRGAIITGGAGSWSREGPDGVINLFGDILGVISQFTLSGCT